MYKLNERIQWVSLCYYFDMLLTNCKILTTDVERCRKKFYGAINNLVVNGKFCRKKVMLVLLSSSVFPSSRMMQEYDEWM